MWRRMHARASVCMYVCVWAQAGNGDSLITERLSQTQIVTNLPRLQNTTFQTGSQSKYSPLIPRLIFKASLFSLSLFLSPHTTNTRTSSNRKRERGERKEENLNLAFREWLGWCLEIFHILFTPDRFQPGTAEGWQGPRPGHKSPVSLSLSPYLPLVSIALKIWISKLFHTASVQSSASNPKQTSTRLAHATLAADLRPGGRTAALIELILFMQQKCGFTTAPLISTYTWDTVVIFTVSWIKLKVPEKKKNMFSCQNPDTWVRKIYFKRLMKEEKRSACPVVFRSIWSFGPLFFLLFSSPLASAALARFDHHVGKLLHARRAAYEVHNGEGLQVLGNAAGSGRGLGVHLVVQGQDLSVQGGETAGISQHAAWREQHAQFCCFPQSQVVPERISLMSRSGLIAPLDLILIWAKLSTFA